MFFSKTEDDSLMNDFPCLTLNVAPTVIPLPGIVYKLTFGRRTGEDILKHFKGIRAYQNNFLLTDVGENQKKLESISPKTVKSLTKFQDKYDTESDEKFLYVMLVPSENANPCVGCIAKMVGVLTEEKMMTISFKTLKRAIVDSPLLNSGDNVWESSVKIVDDEAELSGLSMDQLKNGAMRLSEGFNSVDETINSFKKLYRQSMKQKSSLHLLLLSPLSNTLFFRLNKASFNKAWTIILVYVADLKNNKGETSDKQAFLETLKIMDLVITVLPTSKHQKWMMLSSVGIMERLQVFKDILQNFEQVFKTLYASTEYVQQYFDQASTLDKSRLIANQLKSLRFFIDDVKSQKSSTKMVSPANSTRSLLPGRSNSSKGEDPNEDEDEDEDDAASLKKFLSNLVQFGVHPDGIKMLNKDYKRLTKMTPQNTEYQVLKNYFDIVTDIPFGQYGEKTDSIDVETSRKKLNKDHYGLQTVKRRLLEYLSILKLQEKLGEIKKRAPILLLVGPPGVGKTSIAKSVADVLHRKFQRLSLGGVHGEADIRGHRRTYVGSMCGLIINALRKSGSMNPLILLDEIDKVFSTTGSGAGSASRINGDPGAALLEVLDPEQNNTFMDHYIGFPVDLSQVLFFCTANDLGGISRPLLDRMEVIEIPGYTPEEKIQIGSSFLLPKQIRLNGLDKCHCGFELSRGAWESLVLEYTREPGVRSLERQLATIVRGKVMEVVEAEEFTKRCDTKELQMLHHREIFKYLGFPLHPITRELLEEVKSAEKEGIVHGLSYNSDGTGSVLVFEIIKTGETGHNGPSIISTGNLGNVLQESINIGKSLVKSLLRKGSFPGASPEEFLSSEYHLHVPAGAISKDGPSAGSAIALALLSMAIKRPIAPTICMTGEITLRGKILPIGGLKEKLLGARIYGMKRVLIPLTNRPDLVEAVADDITPFAEVQDRSELQLVRTKMNLEVVYVDTFYDVVKQVWPDIIERSWSDKYQPQEKREGQEQHVLSRL